MVKKAQEEDPQEETSSRGIYATYIVRQQFKICTPPKNKEINTSYLTDSYIIFSLKMESVSKNTIFGLKMMVKSGLEIFF